MRATTCWWGLVFNEPHGLQRGMIGREEVHMKPIHWEDYIEERKDVKLGKPVFKGTRLTVELVLNELGAGTTQQELLENYPTLKPEHIRAAMLYAAAVLTMDAR